MIKREYSEKVKGLKKQRKNIKKEYKANRPPLKVRIRDTVKLFIIKIKKIYKYIFLAWLLIKDLKEEILTLKKEIERYLFELKVYKTNNVVKP